ncbi:RQC (ribosome quality control complex) component [Zygosaccharomyces mellis]|uniref:Ribosome quality control complex subunit 2 n=1 Tax=Zygosaccharomyces mellis TaxID=42258 RepID=A0A4C2ECM1_9SACH|nr:RQC (ribosome quality control complex) component [Zygosaccharomyces mellis]
MKQRISALDLQLLAEELRETLESYRLNNIYNIADSTRQFLLKFNKPDSKFSVVVDCGLRIHLTDYDRPTPPGPSGFVIKLRKHLKSKRLTALRQVHDDRILVLQFADGLYYLVLEFFSAGNVILLDENKKILALQRIVQEHENKVGEQYTMFDDSIFSSNKENNIRDPVTYNEENVKQWHQEAKAKFDAESRVLNEVIPPNKKKDGQRKRVKVMAIHRLLLSKEPHLSSDLLSKNLQMRGFNPSAPYLDFIGQESAIVDLLNTTEKEYQGLLSDAENSGYILAKRNVNFNPERDEKDLEFVYETFHPFEPFVPTENIQDTKTIKIEGGYNKVLDNFFSTIESSKYALRIQHQEQQAAKRLEAARLDNQKKIQSLVDAQFSNEEKGHSIISNADLVEQTKSAVQGYVDQQMDWSTIEKLIQVEQKRGNKIAQLIQLPLNLQENKISICLPDPNEEDEKDGSGSDSASGSDSGSESEDEGSNSDQSSASDVSDFETEETIRDKSPKSSKSKKQREKGLKVSIDLNLSAYANASYYFNIKKSNAEKQRKVEKNVEKAFKNIEEKVERQLKQKLKETHNVLRKVRIPYFFEKHHWFISSEGFLVLMGKSDLETDLIYSKYIEDDDVYLFNTFGTQVWIKNPDKTEVPPNTLMQAGILCMSASEAWSKKISSSPWWCFAKNISKFEPSDNSVLPSGRFLLKNENSKNFMPPAQLVMGFGFLWKVKTEENANEHLEEVPVEEAEEPGKDEGEQPSKEHEELEEPEVSSTQVEERQEEPEARKEKEEPVEVAKSPEPDIKFEDDKENGENASANTGPADQNINKKVRGKKGKLKKMQRKYGDQDEEERQMRLNMLGTLKGMKKQQSKEQEDLQRQQHRDFRKAKLKKQQEAQALKFTKNEKVKVNYKKFRNELKPTLDRYDEILDVIPVCAPWPALLKYKYKVKIQPGNAKKTKTMHEILHHFTTRPMDTEMVDKEADWPSERETIKQLKEQDLILTLSMDKLKVTISGSGNNVSKKDQSKKGKTSKNKKK